MPPCFVIPPFCEITSFGNIPTVYEILPCFMRCCPVLWGAALFYEMLPCFMRCCPVLWDAALFYEMLPRFYEPACFATKWKFDMKQYNSLWTNTQVIFRAPFFIILYNEGKLNSNNVQYDYVWPILYFPS